MSDLSRELRKDVKSRRDQLVHETPEQYPKALVSVRILALEGLLDQADAAEGLLRDLRDGNRLVSEIDDYFEERREK